MKCKRKGTLGFSIISEEHMFPEFPFCPLNSRHEEWCCAKVTHALPQGHPWAAWGPHGGRGRPSPPPRATLSHPMACTLTVACQPRDPSKVRSPAWWSSAQHFCQQCHVLRVLKLSLNSSKQIPQPFRGPSSLFWSSTVDATVVASHIHAFQFPAPAAQGKCSADAAFRLNSLQHLWMKEGGS